MGLNSDVNKRADDLVRGGDSPSLALRRPPLATSLSTTSFASSHQSESADDRVEPYPPSTIQSPGPASVLIPAITVQPEFTTIIRRNTKSVKQAVSCLVTIQVPQAGNRGNYGASVLSPASSKSQVLDAIDVSTPQRPHASDTSSHSDRFASPAADNTVTKVLRHGSDPFSHILVDLKARMNEYKSSGIDKLGNIRLFDILKVRKGSVVLDISVYLFQHALVCVTEEKKKSIRGFLASPSYTSLRNQASEDKGNKREKGILKLKGRIYFKHVRRVIDTSISGEFSLTISMEDENADSFILAFRDKNSLELWRKTIIKAVEEAKGGMVQPKIAISAPMSPSPSIAGKLAKMGFKESSAHSPIATSQDRFETKDSPVRTPTNENAWISGSDALVLSGTTHLLPIHTPLDLLIVCSVPPTSTPSSSSALKIRLIKAAMEHVCSMLGPYDRLSIVTYEHGTGGTVRRTPFLSPGRSEGRNRLQAFLGTLGSTAAKNLQGGMTSDDFAVSLDTETKIDMVTGVNYGLDKVLQRTTKNPLTSMILIHDNCEAIKRAAMDLILARAETAK